MRGDRSSRAAAAFALARPRASVAVAAAALARTRVSVAVAAVVLACASPSFAEPSAADKETARAAWKEGLAKRAEGDHTAALKLFRAVDALMALPTTGIEVARELAALGRVVEARDMALSVARRTGSTPPEKSAVTEATKLYESLGKRISTLVLTITGAPTGEARLHIDGVEVPSAAIALPRKVNPGAHTLVVEADGCAPYRHTVSVAEGGVESVTVVLVPLADANAASASAASPAEAATSAPAKPEPPGPVREKPPPSAARRQVTPAPSRPGVMVRIDSNDDEVKLYRLGASLPVSGGVGAASLSSGAAPAPAPTGVEAVGKSAGPELVCRAPCNTFVDGSRGEPYFLAVDDHRLGPKFHLRDYAIEVVLTATVRRRPSRAALVVASCLLGAGLAVGVAGLVVTTTVRDDPSRIAGAAAWVGGNVVGLLSIPVFLRAGGDYDVDVPRNLGHALLPTTLAFTPPSPFPGGVQTAGLSAAWQL